MTRFPSLRGHVMRFALLAGTLSLPFSAHAQAEEIRDIGLDIVRSFYPVVFILATFALVIAGFVLVSSTDEGALGKAKVTIGAVITGLILTQLAPRINALFFERQMNQGGGQGVVRNAADVFLEFQGLASWLEGLAVIIGVSMIIFSSFRAIASFGDEGAASANRRAVLHAVLGILLIGATGIIRRVLFQDREPNLLIAYVFEKLEILLGFLLIIMMGVLIFAGFLLIANLGNESFVERAKGIVIRAIIGLLLILVSAALITAVLSIFA